MTRRLALFDLDNTLLAGDSDHAFGEYLIQRGLVDAQSHRARNDEFYASYQAGALDIHAYVRFTLGPILAMSEEQREQLHQGFMQDVVTPMILDKARALVAGHKERDDCCVIITATNAFITRPIARAFCVDELLATDLEVLDNRLTGNIKGTPCYQQGKVDKLRDWIAAQETEFALQDSVFYSDSVNDIALLELVAEPVAVDPDEQLHALASARGWNIISLR